MPQSKPRNTRNKSAQPDQKSSKRISQAVEDTKEKGKQIVSEAKEEASKLIDETKQETSKMAKQQMQVVANQIDGIARALTKTADSIEDDQTWVADGVRQTAQTLEKMSESLRVNEFGKLVRNFENYAKQQPVVVLGGAAIAGFFLVKFLKKSSEHLDENDSINDD